MLNNPSVPPIFSLLNCFYHFHDVNDCYDTLVYRLINCSSNYVMALFHVLGWVLGFVFALLYFTLHTLLYFALPYFALPYFAWLGFVSLHCIFTITMLIFLLHFILFQCSTILFCSVQFLSSFFFSSLLFSSLLFPSLLFPSLLFLSLPFPSLLLSSLLFSFISFLFLFWIFHFILFLEYNDILKSLKGSCVRRCQNSIITWYVILPRLVSPPSFVAFFLLPLYAYPIVHLISIHFNHLSFHRRIVLRQS